tara:strand:+ start:216 stop:1388 length:1173 start_codon:yes stop_codon:yes gene_type:complete
MSVGTKKKILYVEPFFWSGGPHNVLVNITKSLNVDEYEPHIVVPKKTKAINSSDIDGIPTTGLSFLHNVGRKGGIFHMIIAVMISLIGAIQVAYYVKKHSIDVIHTNNETCLSGSIGGWLARRPNVVHVHGLGFSDSWAAGIVASILNITADRVIAVSKVVREALLIHGVEESKIKIVPNGIDTARFTPKIICEDISIEFNLSNDYFAVGMIGGLEPRKGHELFLRAAHAVLSEVDNVRFFVIGGGIPDDVHQSRFYQKQMFSLTQDLGIEGAVVFTGHRSDIEELLSVLDIVVQPSNTEAAPLVPLEAMSSGTPVIATDVGGNSEEVVHDETGILVPANDHFALTKAIVDILRSESLRVRLGKSGRVRVLEHFSVEVMALKIQRIYGEL